MRNLIDILIPIGNHEVFGDANRTIMGLSIDSRQVREKYIYIAIKGTHADGHDYIPSAIGQGASVIVCERIPAQVDSSVCYIKVRDTKRMPGLMADAFYFSPSKSMTLVGVTGTNGKTTCTTLLYQLYRKLGYTCGLISTVKYVIGDVEFPSTHTTPDPIRLQELMYEMHQSGCSHVFMEVSSHAVDQERIAGLDFDGAVFTNITRDHLDYHHTFDEYIRVKKRFFDDLKSDAFALVNKDDKRGMVMLQNTKAHKYTYSVNGTGDFNAKLIENSMNGLMLQIDGVDIYTALIGKFNAYNFTAVYATSRLLGQSDEEILPTLSSLKSVDGRFDFVKSQNKNIVGVVDYAHTPDALLNVLQTANDIKDDGQELICVVGCGGDRDKGKRPLMAEVAVTHADKVILTSDNPRSEDPMDIIQEMKSGVPPHLDKKVYVQVDRKEAIKMACGMISTNGVLIVAGKGHETYQEIKGVKYDFDDREILKYYFTEMDL